MSKKVLLTGATGFVGRYLMEYMKEDVNLEVIAYPSNLAEPIDYDKWGGFDCIVNLASLSSVPNSIESPVRTVKNNVDIALNVFEFARRCHPEVVIHFSSVEADTAGNPYAASKAAQEAIATAYHRTYCVPIVLVTSHNIVGPNQSSDKFVPKIIESVKKNEKIQIYATAGHIGSRTYNPINNVASALRFLMLSGRPTELKRFLIDGGEELNNLEMAKKVAGALNKDLKYEVIEASESRPGYSPFLRDRGIPMTTVGWKPDVSLDDALKHIVEEAKE